MAYLLLAVGALMSAAGVYLAVTGAQIVQVEEGWTSVIAGTTLLVGGVVTAALGFILRVLLRLQANGAIHGLSLAAPAVVVPPEPAMAPPALSPVRTAAAEPQPTVAAPTLAAAAQGMATDAPPPGFAAEFADVPHRGAGDFGDRDHEAAVVPHAGYADRPADLHGRRDDIEPAHPEPGHDDRDHEHAGADRLEPDAYGLETPSTPEHDLTPGDTAALPSPAPPAEEDWLDRAFAELDDRPAPTPAPLHPTPRTAQNERSEPAATDLVTAASRENQDIVARPRAVSLPKARSLTPPAPDEAPASREPAPVAGEEPAPAPVHEPIATGAPTDRAPGPGISPAPPAQTSAVIGRYEADGTSYVMYADGSIEAQSEGGVYRFASMAELKAFIES